MADVTIVDTSPRDGPVALPKIATPEKIALANSLMQSGIAKIDCVAFTHPRLRPEYADAEKVKKSSASSIEDPGLPSLALHPTKSPVDAP
jgi:isopropylmalate/homocitrate/citramalate synthase